MFNLLTDDVRAVLTSDWQGRLLITVGHPLRGDDGVGPFMASLLKQEKSCPLLDAGFSPENIVEEAICLKPREVLFLDAAYFGGRPGEACVIPEENIPTTTLTTHAVPLSVISRLIAHMTGAKVVFIGIQPKSTGYHEGLSAEVKATAEEIVRVVKSRIQLPFCG